MRIFATLAGWLKQSSGQEKEKELCEQNLRMIWATAYQYKTANNLSPESVIEIEQLKGYLKYRSIPQCPSGKSPYGAFVMKDGPICPNHPVDHIGPQVKSVTKIHGRSVSQSRN